MPISIRLGDRLVRELNKYARRAGKSKSELIRNLIADFLNKKTNRLSPWELGKEAFGREGSGRGNLAQDRKSILKEKQHAKNNRH
ncbi:MAG: CopG family transcriptional regulator [Desulfobacteraceae bacterium]|nr:MAG: CopG family transcriptional regulator [Desulfobacteraceae bacterium]